jgi:hypothetical protein
VQVFKTNPPTTIAEAVEGVTIHPSSWLTIQRELTLLVIPSL